MLFLILKLLQKIIKRIIYGNFYVLFSFRYDFIFTYNVFVEYVCLEKLCPKLIHRRELAKLPKRKIVLGKQFQLKNKSEKCKILSMELRFRQQLPEKNFHFVKYQLDFQQNGSLVFCRSFLSVDTKILLGEIRRNESIVQKSG